MRTKALPFFITLVFLLVASLVVNTILQGTALYAYAPYINAALAIAIVLTVYKRLTSVIDRYHRQQTPAYTYR